MKVGKQLSSRQAELRARINRTRTKKRVHVLPLNSTKKSDNRPEQGSDPTTLLEDINAAQPIEDLAYYPTVWKCLQFTPVLSQPGKDFLESMDISSRINQNRPYRAALNFARLNDAVPFEQDPIHESDDDEDTCQECHQGWKRIIQSDEEILMQCAVFDRREKRSHGCGLWWHVGCVNRSEQPKGNWLCFACSLNLGVDNLEVNSTGLEVEASDDEETQPTPPKKRARSNTAAKPRTFRKSTRVLRSSKTDDAFELDTSEDEDEEPVPPPKRRRKSPPWQRSPAKTMMMMTPRRSTTNGRPTLVHRLGHPVARRNPKRESSMMTKRKNPLRRTPMLRQSQRRKKRRHGFLEPQASVLRKLSIKSTQRHVRNWKLFRSQWRCCKQ